MSASTNLTTAFAELEKLVAEFESGKIDLEAGIPKFKRGLELAAQIKARLNVLENQITQIKLQSQDSSG